MRKATIGWLKNPGVLKLSTLCIYTNHCYQRGQPRSVAHKVLFYLGKRTAFVIMPYFSLLFSTLSPQHLSLVRYCACWTTCCLSTSSSSTPWKNCHLTMKGNLIPSVHPRTSFFSIRKFIDDWIQCLYFLTYPLQLPHRTTTELIGITWCHGEITSGTSFKNGSGAWVYLSGAACSNSSSSFLLEVNQIRLRFNSTYLRAIRRSGMDTVSPKLLRLFYHSRISEHD